MQEADGHVVIAKWQPDDINLPELQVGFPARAQADLRPIQFWQSTWCCADSPESTQSCFARMSCMVTESKPAVAAMCECKR